MTRYEPADSFETPRFSGVRTFMRLPSTQDLGNADAAIVGAPFDTGATFRAGARFGPEGIRSVSHLLRRYNPSLGVVIFDHLSVIDYGDVPVVPGFIEASYEKIEEGLKPIHQAGVVPIVLGGDHSIALPELRAAAAVHGPLALVQFDSHPDTWDAYFGQKHTHGTPFRRAVEEGLLDTSRSIQVGMRGSIYDEGDWNDAREMGFDLVPTDEVREFGIRRVIDRILERVGDARTYVSFDVDFVDPAFAPGTGTPEIGGFTSREAQEFVRGLAGLDIVGCDVVEVYPTYDPAQITALLAANVAHEFLSLIALNRRVAPRTARSAS
ncbi:MAG: agmatinase [Actinomycetota bacterium]|nr:agmatinase [Actinomycetota bacterium]